MLPSRSTAVYAWCMPFSAWDTLLKHGKVLEKRNWRKFAGAQDLSDFQAPRPCRSGRSTSELPSKGRAFIEVAADWTMPASQFEPRALEQLLKEASRLLAALLGQDLKLKERERECERVRECVCSLCLVM